MHYVGIFHFSHSLSLPLDEVGRLLGHSIILGLKFRLLLKRVHMLFFLILIFLRILIPLVDLSMFQVDSIDAVKFIDRVDVASRDELMEDKLLKLLILLEDTFYNLIEVGEILQI